MKRRNPWRHRKTRAAIMRGIRAWHRKRRRLKRIDNYGMEVWLRWAKHAVKSAAKPAA